MDYNSNFAVTKLLKEQSRERSLKGNSNLQHDDFISFFKSKDWRTCWTCHLGYCAVCWADYRSIDDPASRSAAVLEPRA
ncbi:hypothetical protein V6N11_061040 [Hibiscus sabdariffa]|uniref:Uncharacterized protein n=1 Tax=Hibiscus sabdariffa TaxID=183260 RepID=A0ABR2QS29_9ROSI